MSEKVDRNKNAAGTDDLDVLSDAEFLCRLQQLSVKDDSSDGVRILWADFQRVMMLADVGARTLAFSRRY